MSTDTVSALPQQVRRRCTIAAALVVVLFAVAAVLLRQGAGHRAFGGSDQIAIFVLGVAVAAGIMLPAQSRLRADATSLRVRNVLMSHDVPWELVAAVRFDDRSPWASLEFLDGDVLALMALRASDGERAVRDVRALRALHEVSTARRGA